MTRPILVFGAGGQVGNALMDVAHLSGEPNPHGLAFIGRHMGGCDITEPASVSAAFSSYKPRAVINCAVYRDVDAAEENQEAATQVNVWGVENLAKACAAADIPLIQISSDYVFSGEADRPYVETDLALPQTHFGLTKLQGEECAKLAPKHVIIRTSWVYGPHGRNFLKTIVGKQGEISIDVVDDQTGTPTHSADLARAILTATERVIADPSVSGTYHFAGEGPCTWCEFAREILARMFYARWDAGPRVNPITTAQSGAKAKRPRYSALDSSLFARTFGVTARPRAQRIAETVQALTPP